MSQRGTSATPARNTRARNKTPLPALEPRLSTAYGSRGKTDLRAQARSSGSDFASAFSKSRAQQVRQSTVAEESEIQVADELEDEAEVQEDDEQDLVVDIPPTTKRSSRPKPGGRGTEAPAAMDRTDVTASSAMVDRSLTTLDAGANYRQRFEDARPDYRQRFEDAASVPQDTRYRLPTDLGSYAPNFLRVFLHTLPRYPGELARSANFTLKGTVLALASLIVAVFIFAHSPVPDRFAPYKANFFHYLKGATGISPYDRPPDEVERLWMAFRSNTMFSEMLPGYAIPEMQPMINTLLLDRITRIEEKMRVLKGDMTLQNETLVTLRDMLPGHLAVRVVDGVYEIPEDFWDALRERVTSNEDDVTPLWQAYMQRNEGRIQQLTADHVSTALTKGVHDKQILTREVFLEAINQNNDYLSQKYVSDFNDLWHKNFEYVKEVASTAATDIVERSPASMYARQQLEVLTKANQIHNAYQALHTTNWFSPGLGARILPHLTSPTKQAPSSSLLERLYRKLSPIYTAPHPPIVALQDWKEATDCWCAAPIPTNSATTLTIQIAAKIFPEKFIVEHIPALGTPSIASAPRDLEVWAETPSTSHAEQLTALLSEQNSFSPGTQCSSPSPGKKFVCIAQGRYDIHQHNYVQSFGMAADLKELGFAAEKFVVRVVRNWGAEWTCLYRVRMTGERVAGGTGGEGF